MSTAPTNTQTEAEPAAPVPGSDEYNAAMAAKYREAHGDGEQTEGEDGGAEVPTRPDWVPEKFWDAEKGVIRTEELAKSYAELESKGSKKADETKPEADADKDTPESEEDKAVNDIVKAAGLSTETLRDKIINTGTLDESDYAALTKVGMPRELVEEYVNLSKFYVETTRENVKKSVTERAGGDEQLTQLLDWAAANLPEKDKVAYNRMLASEEWPAAIDALKTKKAAAAKNADEPNLVVPSQTSPAGGAAGYQDRSEMVRDMKDPRYRTDASFRKEVEQKVARAVWNQ